jgi:hypothetical protein
MSNSNRNGVSEEFIDREKIRFIALCRQVHTLDCNNRKKPKPKPLLPCESEIARRISELELDYSFQEGKTTSTLLLLPPETRS